jgi:hypothetical protein
MLFGKRGLLCLTLATPISLLVYYRSASVSVTVRTLQTKVPQVVGLGDYFDPDTQNLGDNQDHHASGLKDGDVLAAEDLDTGGLSPVLPPDSTYTRNLIMPMMKHDNLSWFNELDLGPNLTQLIYVADDPKAPLHPPINKGNEAMTYLTYIIDHYDNLADVNIFMHSHLTAWHNDELLNWDAGEMIRRLSSERVQRKGYMNMRCHWNPGCPDWIHPGQVERDKEKPEQEMMASAWAVLFPDKPIPAVLAQPCCSQFAVSRSQIRKTPLARYKHYRKWLQRSDIRNSMTGRIFEYVWQVIFTDESVFCPSQRACYCDGFGVCFENDQTFDKWFEIRYQRQRAEADLSEWEEKAQKIRDFQSEDGRWLPEVEMEELQIPEPGKRELMMTFIREQNDELERRRLEALERGRDPRIRAESDGRPWKDGDGF